MNLSCKMRDYEHDIYVICKSEDMLNNKESRTNSVRLPSKYSVLHHC